MDRYIRPGDLSSHFCQYRRDRPGAVRSDDGAIPALGRQPVVVDVRISAAVAHINRRAPMPREFRKPEDLENRLDTIWAKSRALPALALPNSGTWRMRAVQSQ